MSIFPLAKVEGVPPGWCLLPLQAHPQINGFRSRYLLPRYLLRRSKQEIYAGLAALDLGGFKCGLSRDRSLEIENPTEEELLLILGDPIFLRR